MNKNIDLIKQQFEVIRQFSTFRSMLRIYLGEANKNKAEKDFGYISSLMHMPVTNKSQFRDSKWDYSDDEHGASVNCQGSTLIIDYGKFESIPEFIITEVKCITHLYFLRPSSFKCKGRKRNRIKANTLVGITKYGLAYLETLFKGMEREYGKEYIESRLYSLTEINRSIFDNAAIEHEQVFNADLKVFLDNLSHPSAENVFDGKVDIGNSESLSWKLLPGHTRRSPQQVIPEEVVEPLIFNASLLVVDFLLTQGIEAEDKVTIKHLELGSHSVGLCSDLKLNREVFDAYAALRLINAGYDKSCIFSYISNHEVNDLASDGRKLFCVNTIREGIQRRTGSTISEIKEHLSIVKYAAQYLVAQFTGMRPGELSEIPVKCLIEEKGFQLLKGRIIKGRERRFKGLFDDKWIVIPIMNDSIQALNRLECIYKNKKLFSSVNTIGPNDEQTDMRSSSWTFQVEILLKFLFKNKNPHGLKFNAYMTRHTLAHLMFRADVGLPFISYQLKHLVDDVARYTTQGMHSDITVSYGSIGDELAKGTSGLRKRAEVERVKSVMDPHGTYLGPRGEEHKKHLKKLFQGYIAEGYSEEEVFEAMAEQGVALVNVGQGFCYGGRMEDFDESIPCIGSLRCNPLRCENAIVTKANAPKWREVYTANKMNLGKPEYVDNQPQMLEAMREAESVLHYLGEKVIL